MPLLFAAVAAPAAPPAPYVRVLGIAQDAGIPQAGCRKVCCARGEGRRCPVSRSRTRRAGDGGCSMRRPTSPSNWQRWSRRAAARGRRVRDARPHRALRRSGPFRPRGDGRAWCSRMGDAADARVPRGQRAVGSTGAASQHRAAATRRGFVDRSRQRAQGDPVPSAASRRVLRDGRVPNRQRCKGGPLPARHRQMGAMGRKHRGGDRRSGRGMARRHLPRRSGAAGRISRRFPIRSSSSRSSASRPAGPRARQDPLHPPQPHQRGRPPGSPQRRALERAGFRVARAGERVPF